MLSSTTEYALRAVTWLAHRGEAPATVDQIARATDVPTAYLSKVLQTLGRANVVRSQRGIGGGYSLAKAPAEIAVIEIIDAVDPVRRIKSCPLKLSEHGTRLCPLHARLDAAIGMIRDAFSSCTVRDLLSTANGSAPLCAPAPAEQDAPAEPEEPSDAG